MLNIKCFNFNNFQERCSIIWDDSGKAAIVDPGCYVPDEVNALTGYIKEHGLAVEKIMLTHAHFDHIYGVRELADLYKVPVLMDPADKVILENEDHFCRMFGLRVPDTAFNTVDIADGDKFNVGTLVFEVLSTPGHTPGGVCYLCRDEKLLFSGDTLFEGSIGRTDNKWGDYDALMKGIFEKLMVLDGDTTVVPGHGRPTTIAEERMKNPFLLPFNEPYEDED